MTGEVHFKFGRSYCEGLVRETRTRSGKKTPKKTRLSKHKIQIDELKYDGSTKTNEITESVE